MTGKVLAPEVGQPAFMCGLKSFSAAHSSQSQAFIHSLTHLDNTLQSLMNNHSLNYQEGKRRTCVQ